MACQVLSKFKQIDDPKTMDLIYMGKALPNSESLDPDPMLVLQPYCTMHLVKRKHVVGGMLSKGQGEENKSATQN